MFESNETLFGIYKNIRYRTYYFHFLKTTVVNFLSKSIKIYAARY